MTPTTREALLMLIAIRRSFELNIPTHDLLAMMRRGSALAQRAIDEAASGAAPAQGAGSGEGA